MNDDSCQWLSDMHSGRPIFVSLFLSLSVLSETLSNYYRPYIMRRKYVKRKHICN